MPELYREFAAAKWRQEDRFEEATIVAFQTIRVWVLTKNKKKMPEFKTLLPNARGPKGTSRQNHAQMEAMMHMMAERIGGKVRNPRLGKGAE